MAYTYKPPMMPNYSPNYGGGSGSGIGLTGPSNVPPITPGGTADIDAGYQFRQDGYNNAMGLYGQSQQSAYNTASQAYLNQLNANLGIQSQAGGMWTNADKQAALGKFSGSDSFYTGMMGNGGYDPAMIQSLKSAQQASIMDKANSIASSVNNALSQHGLGANPYAGMQARAAGNFNAAGQVGRLDADLKQQQLQNEFQGASGSASNAAQEGQLYGKATSEDMLKQVKPTGAAPTAWDPTGAGATAIYDQYRNSNGRSDATGGSGGGYGSSGGTAPIYSAPKYNYTGGYY